MGTLQTVLLTGHTLIALLIIILVLMQRGKGADAGAAFGAGASGTVFGARGSSSFFSRMTAVLATVFFATSLGLAFMSGQSADAPDSLIESAPVIEEDDAPAVDGLPELPDLEGAPAADDSAQDMPALEGPAIDGPAAEGETPENAQDGESQ